MKRFAVIGLGRFGKRLACKLAEAGAEVIAIDRDQSIVESVRDSVSLAVCLDSLDEDALRSQGIHEVDVAVVGIGENFEDSALTTVILKKKLHVAQVLSRATSGIRAEILAGLGADEVINPENEAAERWCNYLLGPEMIQRTPLAAGHSMVRMVAHRSFHGKTLKSLAVRTNYNVNVVGILRTIEQHDEDGKVTARREEMMVAMPDSEILPDDVLLLVGRDEDIKDLPTG